MRLLVIDNYDSFTYNLVQYFGELGAECEVLRNDAKALGQITIEEYHVLVLSGPCDPTGRASACPQCSNGRGKTTFRGLPRHQCIGQAFGGKIVRASKLMHGKTSPIRHDGADLFKDLPSPLVATRYHSLVVESSSLPDCLDITAHTDEGEIMGIRHKDLPVWGCSVPSRIPCHRKRNYDLEELPGILLNT